MNIELQFSGGMELLFDGQRSIKVVLPSNVTTMRDLIAYTKDHYLKERPELFVQGDSVRPGILVLINDADWELEGELEYELAEKDVIVFISTLHGGNHLGFAEAFPCNTQLTGKENISASDWLGASGRCQWLPSVFEVEDDSVDVYSYINNLNSRKHPELQDTIKSVFEAMIPMFELALGSLRLIDPETRIEASMDINDYQQRQWEWEFNEYVRHKFGVKDLKDPAMPKTIDERDFTEFRRQLGLQQRSPPFKIPGLPASFEEPIDSGIYSLSLAGRGVQVIVKMANIHLTPENPVFNGGNWHLEGMDNEAIAAIGIYYYSTENITTSCLSFRNVCTSDQWLLPSFLRHKIFDEVFGVIKSNDSDQIAQVAGHIEAIQSRCVVFPNHFHHKAGAFELEDKTRPGHRKMLAFFLVNPDYQTISTADVGMQQVDWLAEELYEACGLKAKLPLEVVRLIALFTGAVMTEKEARVYARQDVEDKKNIGQGRTIDPMLIQSMD
ncbi:hypothetical protein HDU79_009942 [Rhizoclosmatium sp. JEL0117]|nr:hypothetical protein HDU79_009942 [Rhizoclosmatium sp. JEL0117]